MNSTAIVLTSYIGRSLWRRAMVSGLATAYPMRRPAAPHALANVLATIRFRDVVVQEAADHGWNGWYASSRSKTDPIASHSSSIWRSTSGDTVVPVGLSGLGRHTSFGRRLRTNSRRASASSHGPLAAG